MDEARRFLRYVTPGGLFLGETIGLLFVLFPRWMAGAFEGLHDDAGIGFAVAGFLATGAAGFFLSTVHHGRFNLQGHLDYSKAIRTLVSNGMLVVEDVERSAPVDPSRIDRRVAFAVLTSVWHQLSEVSPRLKGVDRRAVALADLAHSLGTAFVASIIAPFVVFVVAVVSGEHSLSTESVLRTVGAVAISALVGAVLLFNYRTASYTCQAVVEESLADALVEAGQPPLVTFRTHVLLRS